MRVGFFGTPALSARYLEALAARHEIVGVVTQPDRARGRSGEPQPSPVKEGALRLGAPVFQPEQGRCSQACASLQEQRPDICVVVAFGRKLPCGDADCAVGQCINVHYSLLPQLRGAAPVQHAILQGLAEAGVTIQHVAPGIDEGDIIAQRALDILADDTCGSLTERLTNVGIESLLAVLEAVAAGTATRTPQDHSQATDAPIVKKQDGKVNWGEPAEMIARKVRAFDPWPGVTMSIRGRPVKILRAQAENDCSLRGGEVGRVVEIALAVGFAVSCETGRLWVQEVQPAGKKAMTAADYLRGARLEVGAQIG